MHFSVLVIGDDVDEKMAPYDEGLHDIEIVNTYDELLEIYKGEIYMSNPIKWLKENHKDLETAGEDLLYIDEDGNCQLYRSNLEARYDWYVEGGRWEDAIQLKDGVTYPENSRRAQQLPYLDLDYLELLIQGRTFKAKVKDIFKVDANRILAVVDEYGDWHESGDGDIDIPSLIEQKLSELDPEEIITIVDCHV